MKLLVILFVIQLLAVSIPGPDFFIVMKCSLKFGRLAGVFATLGIATGIGAIYCPIALFFIKAIQQYYITYLQLLSILGSFYLLYLAYGCFKATKTQVNFVVTGLVNQARANHYLKSYGLGLITNLSNPKVMIYFISIFPVFVPKSASHGFSLAVISVITLSSMAWFVLIACVIGHAKVRMYLAQYIHYVEYVLALLFTGFAIWLLVDNVGYFIR